MIRSNVNGVKCSAKRYSQEVFGQAIASLMAFGHADPECSDRELALIKDQMTKIGERLLSKLKFALSSATVTEDDTDTEE